MKQRAIHITNKLIEKGVINADYKEIYRYGFESLFSAAFELISIFVLAFLFGNFFETLLFFLTFIPLRLYAGGYHARTHFKCYILSIMMYILFSAIIYFTPSNLIAGFSLIFSLLSLIIVFLFSPVVHSNRYADKEHINKCRKISLIIVALGTLFIFVGSCIFPKSIAIFAMSLGFLTECISIVAVKINRKRRDKNEVFERQSDSIY